LPTYSIPLTDAAWDVLDVPIINEIEKSVKSFYTVNISNKTNQFASNENFRLETSSKKSSEENKNHNT